jgi:hypothetical protein
MSSVIEQTVQARLVAADPRAQTVTATLHYDRDDPFAVRIEFPPVATLEGVVVAWTFARELLTAGLEEDAGHGDVCVRPYRFERTVLEFHAPEGRALVHIRTAELRHFLRCVEELVPAGHEHRYLDMDHALAELLGDAR